MISYVTGEFQLFIYIEIIFFYLKKLLNYKRNLKLFFLYFRGNCHPCYRSTFEELHCECGASVIYPPIPCNTKRPSCNRPCSRSHPCDHPVFHECHSEPECPPCMAFTTQWCYGKHEQRKTIRCSQNSFSCGLPCNKDLSCGNHKCIKPCHEGPCQNGPKDICKQNCKTLRSCDHPCNLPCHKGECPESICKQMVNIKYFPWFIIFIFFLFTG